MAATREDVSRWFDEAKSNSKPFMIVVCDTFDYEDYPVYVDKAEDFWKTYDLYDKRSNMQKIMEVYDLSLGKEDQMNEFRAWHTPPKDTP